MSAGNLGRGGEGLNIFFGAEMPTKSGEFSMLRLKFSSEGEVFKRE